MGWRFPARADGTRFDQRLLHHFQGVDLDESCSVETKKGVLPPGSGPSTTELQDQKRSGVSSNDQKHMRKSSQLIARSPDSHIKDAKNAALVTWWLRCYQQLGRFVALPLR